MAAHLNILTTYGVTIHATAQADDVQRTTSVEVNELQGQANGEVIKADPINMAKIEVAISGDGPVSLAGVSSAVIATPGDLVIIKAGMKEAPNSRVTFNVTAEGNISFADPVAASLDAGAEPTIDDLEITSVEYAAAESIDRSVEVENKVLPGSNGTPFARGTVKRTLPFSFAGRGDLPPGVALGSGGVAGAGLGTGKTVVRTLVEGEKRGDWNRWSADGANYPQAA